MRHALGLLLAAALLIAAVPAEAQVAQREKDKAQNKLLAMRAARVDAMRKLAERINGLRITSETTVQDFVATNDRIETAMMSWLSGMKEVGKPEFTPDGICQVTLEVTLQEVITELQKLHKTYYRGNKIRIEDFEKIKTTTTEKVFRETGSGAPPVEFQPRGVLVPPQTSGADIMSKAAWAYWMAHCTGQGRLMAEQAARVDALRKLGERVNGVLITSNTTVRDFVAENDDINTRMQAFLAGARKVGLRYHENELIVEVDMEVTVRDLVANLKKWRQDYYRGNRVSTRDIEQIQVRFEDKDIRETGMGVPGDRFLKDVPPAGIAAIGLANAAQTWPPVARATGQAALDTSNTNAAQAKLMAMRAAELDGRRKLAEELDGLRISSETTVADFVAMNDQIETSMLTFQQGARRVNGSERLLPDGTAEVIVEIDLAPLQNMVLYWEQKLQLKVR